MQQAHVLVLDFSVDPAIYRPVGHWAADLGATHEALRVVDGELPDDPARFTHCILTGSEASINGDDDWILAGCEAVRRAAGEGLAILGSCFGHQLLVRALSGRRHVGRSPTPEFGWVRLDWDEAGRAADPVCAGLPSPAWCFAAHFDEVRDLPGEDWATLASTPRCRHAVVRWRRGRAWGFQHHPEIAADEGGRLYRDLLAAMPDRAEALREGWHGECRDSCLTPALLQAFLRA